MKTDPQDNIETISLSDDLDGLRSKIVSLEKELASIRSDTVTKLVSNKSEATLSHKKPAIIYKEDLASLVKILLLMSTPEIQARIMIDRPMNGGGAEIPERPEPREPREPKEPHEHHEPVEKSWFEKVKDKVHETLNRLREDAGHIEHGDFDKVSQETKTQIAESVRDYMNGNSQVEIPVGDKSAVIISKDNDNNVGVGFKIKF